VQHIDVGLVNTLESTLAGIDSNRADTENTSQLDTVTGLAEIDELIVNADGDRMRRLTSRYRIGCLLKFDNLLVFERTSVVNDQHGILGLADLTRTLGRFTNLATIETNVNRMVANIATEEGILHVGNNGGCTDD
jgi:hypothetical protein